MSESEPTSNGTSISSDHLPPLSFHPILSACPLTTDDLDSNYGTVSSPDTDASDSMLALCVDDVNSTSDVGEDRSSSSLMNQKSASDALPCECSTSASSPSEHSLRLSIIKKSEECVGKTCGNDDNGEDDGEFFDYQKVRRTTSLKSGKTPPIGSPRCKKEVRFADALGLDLESVRQILNSNDPPIIPASATKHLHLPSDMDDFLFCRRRLLHACFAQPGDSPTFLSRVTERRVALQSCVVTANAVNGIIRVANIAYEKRVSVRFSLDGWQTFTDIPATYVDGSNDGSTDKFCFGIVLPESFGSAMEFSVRFVAGGNDGDVFWDSNFGANYRIECYIR